MKNVAKSVDQHLVLLKQIVNLLIAYTVFVKSEKSPKNALPEFFVSNLSVTHPRRGCWGGVKCPCSFQPLKTFLILV